MATLSYPAKCSKEYLIRLKVSRLWDNGFRLDARVFSNSGWCLAGGLKGDFKSGRFS